MDFVSFLAPLFGIAFFVERVLEAVWNVVELQQGIQVTKKQNPENYTRIKQIISVVLGVIIAVLTANALNIMMFSQIVRDSGIDPATDRIVSGAIAGAIAPYAHQIFEALLNFQKLLEQQKKQIENPMPNS